MLYLSISDVLQFEKCPLAYYYKRNPPGGMESLTYLRYGANIYRQIVNSRLANACDQKSCEPLIKSAEKKWNSSQKSRIDPERDDHSDTFIYEMMLVSIRHYFHFRRQWKESVHLIHNVEQSWEIHPNVVFKHRIHSLGQCADGNRFSLRHRFGSGRPHADPKDLILISDYLALKSHNHDSETTLIVRTYHPWFDRSFALLPGSDSEAYWYKRIPPVAAQIAGSHRFESRTGEHCFSCAYQQYCPALNSSHEDVRDYGDSLAFRLAAQYYDTIKRLHRLNSEQLKLQQSLVRLMISQQLECIRSPGGKELVRLHTELKLPPKDSAARKQLESKLTHYRYDGNLRANSIKKWLKNTDIDEIGIHDIWGLISHPKLVCPE